MTTKRSKSKQPTKHRHPPVVDPPPRRANWFLYFSILASLAVVGVVVLINRSGDGNQRPVAKSAYRSDYTLSQIPFDGKKAYGYLKQICELGPRFSGSPGMAAQQQLLTGHFTAADGAVERQEFQVRHPETGDPVPMANLIVRWHPEKTRRILLCAHYDTRPFPDRDPNPRLRKSVFIGANDGASGVSVLMELAHSIPNLPCQSGIDFVLFDGEEFVFDDDRDAYFLGSEYFAKVYSQGSADYQYAAAVLLDMVGDKDLRIFQEQQSVSWPDSRPLVDSLWETAQRLKVREFVPRVKYKILDDHVKLHEIGGIPAFDIIDFEYPQYPGWGKSYWHTTADTPDKCSALSLAKVGWVVREWLAEQ